MSGIEVVFGEIGEHDSVQYEGSCSFETDSECFRMMADSLPSDGPLSAVMESMRKGEITGALSSTATTVSSTMASQWISHMKKSFKKRPIVLSEEQQLSILRVCGRPPELFHLLSPKDEPLHEILQLYHRGLEAHHDGRYREGFELLRPCIPYLNTNILIWIRVSEALVYEFYEETWEFTDIYARLFANHPRIYRSSEQRRNNELRPRHDDMNLRFAEAALLLTFVLSKNSHREPVHFAAATLYSFLLLKMKRYTEAIETIDYIVEIYDKSTEWQDEYTILLTYKAEAMIGIGRYNRAIEYSLRVLGMTQSHRLKHRAWMLAAIAYMRKKNFKKAYDCVLKIFSEGKLDEVMLENVALLGLNLAHLMGNSDLSKRFTLMLGRIVY
ncbi:unnamed protein product [Caenorhabditis sp. 36 PRJEB53466]|nr:unnamed protein product [Caenorhabditis sp. 36 PRJEB53466]